MGARARRQDVRYRRLLKVCRERGCSRDDARDLTQEAHALLFEYQRSRKVRDPDSLLRRIIINLTASHHHRKLWASYALERVEEVDRRGLLVDPDAGPERTTQARQLLDATVKILSARSDRTCRIYVAQRAGYSYEEIASAFGIKHRTVEKHVARAVARLKGMRLHQ